MAGLGLFVAVSVIAGYGPPSIEKPLGALPVVRDYLARLDLAGTIDRLAPMRADVGRVSHGQVIAALVANRLTSPTPLSHVASWAREWAVEEMFDIPPDALNDDRVGRALDALAPVCEQVVGSVGAAAIAAFGLDVSRIHWDMTSISLYGDYSETDGDYATPKYGHPKDRRPDLKQVQAGLAITGDGGIPLVHRAYDGGAGEVSQVTGALRALVDLAGPRAFLLVGDTKLVSYGNLTALTSTPGVTFLAPAPRTVVSAEVLAGQDWATATIIEFVAARDRDKPIHARAGYRAREGVTVLRGPRKKDPPVTVRTVFVWSSANDQAAKAARVLKLDRAREALNTLARAAGGHHLYRTEAAVKARLAFLATKHRVSRYLIAQTSVDPDTGPDLALRPDGPGRRGRNRRLVRPADQPGRHRRPGRGPRPLQGPGGLRTPLRRVQGAARGRADVPALQPADPRPHPRDLPGAARLLAHRAPSPPRRGPRREDPRPLRRSSRPPHRGTRPRHTQQAAPRASPERPTRLHPAPTAPAPAPPRRPWRGPDQATLINSRVGRRIEIPCAKDGSR
ncbi:IS1634 family transposase [Parafrankia sp. FMc6]|uniref:IS1634 family transposase n=1 Tax=Parafrankia soli TaxID=2599596 RepID=UPI0034D3F7D8